ncbi:MAG: manganese efflux pump MntP family protein [Smithellaceae bacterium]|jgi:putative Mn2+ efflux pump MntP
MSLVTIFFLAVSLGVDAFSVAIGIGASNIHGYEPTKQDLETDSATNREVSYPPFCGIVQLANSNTLRFWNWSFTNTKSWQPVLRLASSFGAFQFAMPIIGWLAGLTIVNIVAGYDHWVAFALLAYVGGRMIWETLKKEKEKETNDQTKGWPLLMLSIATSIDALAVGFSFSLLKTEIIFPAVIIGIVCFFMTVTGMLFSKGLAGIFGKKVGIFGGVVLIVIGVKILIDHWR